MIEGMVELGRERARGGRIVAVKVGGETACVSYFFF